MLQLLLFLIGIVFAKQEIHFTSSLSEDFRLSALDDSYHPVTSFRITLTALDDSAPQTNETFYIKFGWSDSTASKSIDVSYIDPSRGGDFVQITIQKSNSALDLVVKGSQLGEAVFSINCGGQLYTPYVFYKSDSVKKWAVAAPFNALYKKLSKKEELDGLAKHFLKAKKVGENVAEKIDVLNAAISEILRNSKSVVDCNVKKSSCKNDLKESNLHFSVQFHDHEDWDPTLPILGKRSDDVPTFTKYSNASLRKYAPGKDLMVMKNKYVTGIRAWSSGILKWIQRKARDVSAEVVKIVKNVKKIFCYAVESFITFVEPPIKIVVSSIQRGFMVLVVHPFGKVVTTVVVNVTAALKIVQWLFIKAFGSLAPVIDYFKFVFNWKDIFNAHKVFAHTLKMTPVTEVVSELIKKEISGGINDVEKILVDKLTGGIVVDSTTTGTLPPIEMQQITDGLKTDTGGNLIMNMISCSSGSVLAKIGMDKDKAREFEMELLPLISPENTNEETMSKLQDITSFDQPDGRLTNKGFNGFLIDVIQKLFPMIRKFVTSTITAITFTLKKFIDFFGNTVIPIPVISWVFEKLTGTKLTILDLLALFVSAPSVIITKLFERTIVPESRIDELSSWGKAELASYFNEPLDLTKPAHFVMNFILLKIFPFIDGFVGMFTDGLSRLIKAGHYISVGLQAPNLSFNIVQWVLDTIASIEPPSAYSDQPDLHRMMWVNYAINWGIIGAELAVITTVSVTVPTLLVGWGRTLQGTIDMAFACIAPTQVSFTEKIRDVAFKIDMSSIFLNGLGKFLVGPQCLLVWNSCVNLSGSVLVFTAYVLKVALGIARFGMD